MSMELLYKHDGEIDLGDGHWLRFMGWAPDRELNPQFANSPDNPKIGGIIRHQRDDGTMCEGAIWFDCQQTRDHFPGHPMWTVQSWEPLTCAPSVACHCGDHGFIREGKWVRA
jgi:hypothetical protein